MSRIRIVLALSALIITTLACTMFVGGPDYPEGTIPVSAQAVESLRAQIEAATLDRAEAILLKYLELNRLSDWQPGQAGQRGQKIGWVGRPSESRGNVVTGN